MYQEGSMPPTGEANRALMQVKGGFVLCVQKLSIKFAFLLLPFANSDERSRLRLAMQMNGL